MALRGVAVFAAVLALAGCGRGSGDGGSGDAACDTGRTCSDGSPTGSGDGTVYRGALTVLQDDPEGSPELCGAVAESYPPQCGGLPVSGWDWESVAHEEASGVRWGAYLVTGVFDGESLVLSEAAVPLDEVDLSDYPELAYADPEFGDPAEELGEAELQAIADEVAAAFPAVVFGGWADVDHGVALVDALLVTPEMEAFAAERFPADTVVFTSVFKPVEG
ncbi:hypothetical protein [Glycomyces paridis]|uniref:hypothetical protein n=1 Tax=Glycomyces paridis TaxID=2126555 RepID=UPI001956E84B|nr:hypothetical protein [Glycomyces paridis]